MTDFASFGPFRLFMAERLLEKANEPFELGSRALDILITLVERAGEVVTHKELISRVWPDVIVEEANLRVHIAGLRKALGDGRDGARYVTNVVGRGYCFVAPVTRSAAQRSTPSTRQLVSDRLCQLPARLKRMVGRDDIVRELSAQLMTRRFVSIVGPGGMGKTTVAVSIAHALINEFEGAVFFVDLGALTDPDLVPTAVASALGTMTRTEDPFHSLLAFLGNRRVLLLIDSCEHVIDAAAALAEPIVSEAPQAHILATSREALRVEGEHVHLLHPLDAPLNDVGLTAAEALTFPAVQLFMERAAASGNRSELSDGDAPIVARICRRLDGIALAIELAAGRVSSHGIRGTAQLLDNRFKLVWQGRRTAPPRHQTLNAMLDWSYNLLHERDKLVLCRLSVFVGVFTLSAALAVAGTEANDAETADAVANLVAKSLISTVTIGEPTYYRLLDTTQAYSAGKLADHGEADNVARRHADYYSTYLGHDEIIQSASGTHDLSGYAPHIGNVRAALEWAFSDHGDIAVGVELATCAAPLFVGLSLLDECRNWCEQALASLDDAGRGTRREMILQEALALSSMFTKGNGDEVRAAIERGIALAETFEDRDHQLQLLAGLNIFLTRIGDFRGALTVAGHDLRGPLQIIQGSYDLLGTGVKTKSEQRRLQSGQHAINCLNGMLDQLLGAVRLCEHLEEAKLSPVALEPLFRQACLENAEGALRKEIDIRVCPTRASVMSNPVLLNGILRNLVGNAIKYTEPNGRILIGCRRSGQNVRIDVCDTGIGIAGEQLSRIFEAFTRLESTRCDGLGVGLFIVRRAIEALGHRIDVSSVASRGSRFSIFAARMD